MSQSRSFGGCDTVRSSDKTQPYGAALTAWSVEHGGSSAMKRTLVVHNVGNLDYRAEATARLFSSTLKKIKMIRELAFGGHYSA